MEQSGTTILLIEDDVTIASLVSEYLVRSGFRSHVVHRWDEAVAMFHEIKPDLVILDLNLPGVSGFEILQQLRIQETLPILVLSARFSEDDRVRCLELGADDYIGKPFSVRELLARINRHLVRSSKERIIEKNATIELWKVRIIPAEYTVFVNGVASRFTKTEFEILAHLMGHIDQVVERKTLMNEIIGYDHYLSDRTIDTHIKNIRKKVEGFLVIETIRAIGYRLSVSL